MLVHAVGLVDLDLLEARVAERVARTRLAVSAPAMQPVHCSMSARVAASMSGSAITSETAKRPPGRSTRAASARTFALVAPTRLITQFEITTSTDVVGERDLLDVALEELDVRHAGLGALRAGELEHLVGHVEADRLAGRRRRGARRSARRRRRPSRGRAPSRPRAGRRPRWERRSRARPRPPPLGAASPLVVVEGPPKTSLPSLSVDAMSWPQPAMRPRRRSSRTRCSQPPRSAAAA